MAHVRAQAVRCLFQDPIGSRETEHVNCKSQQSSVTSCRHFDTGLMAGVSVPCVSVDTWLLLCASTRLIPKSAICTGALQGLGAARSALPMLVMRQALPTPGFGAMQLQASACVLICLPKLAHDMLALCTINRLSLCTRSRKLL